MPDRPLVSSTAFAHLHPTGSHPESQQRLVVLHERFGSSRAHPPPRPTILRCHTRATGRSRCGPSAAGSTRTRSAPRRPTRRPCSLPARRSRRCGSAASRWRARPATTPNGRGRWGSASSTRSRSPPAGRRRSSAWSGSRSSTGTSTTATARRTSSADDPSILFVSLHQWPFYPGTGGPAEQGETLVNLPLAAGLRRRRVLRGVADGRTRRHRLRARPAARLGGLRRPCRRSARRHAAERRRLPRARPPRGRHSPRASPPSSRAATTCARCPTWSRPRSKASRRRCEHSGAGPSRRPSKWAISASVFLFHHHSTSENSGS